MKKLKVYVLIIWICLLAPEVLYEPDLGFIERADGQEMTRDEAYRLYVDEYYSGSNEVTFNYKLKISELLRRIDIR